MVQIMRQQALLVPAIMQANLVSIGDFSLYRAGAVDVADPGGFRTRYCQRPTAPRLIAAS